MKIRMGIFYAALLFLNSQIVFAQTAAQSTVNDQTAVEVTVYNSNLGLVKDTRKIQLPVGQGELRFMDVAAQIMPVTVHVKSLTDPNSLTVLEQNYEYDLMSPEKLLDKYVGKKIKLIDQHEYQDRKDILEATLLSNNQGQPIYQIGNEIYLGHPGLQVLPEIPENLIAKPTLTWLYDNKSQTSHNIEVSYLTANINWNADYVIVLDKNDKSADLSGWVTINNQSGATFKEASLKLVAGEVNRVQPMRESVYAMRADVPMASKAAPQFEEKAFFEYHIYDLQRKTTIKDNQTKQISLLESTGVTIQKEFIVYGIQGYWTSQYLPENPKQPVSVYVKFKNSKENRLGMPLPEGIMRLYKKDDADKLQFIGEDHIEHTPKDEEVRLKLGEAFDIVAERIQKDFKQVTTRQYETEWQITLRNHKKEGVTVSLVEPLWGSWQILSNSHPYTKKDAHTIQFDIPVPQDKEVKVTYRIRVGV